MAFDKKPENLPSVGSFRQMAAQQQAMRPRSNGGSGGGARPYWVGAYKPSLDAVDKIRIIPGSYTVDIGVLQADKSYEIIQQTYQYYPYIEHYHGTMKRGALCCGGPLHFTKDKREPCYGCDNYWADRTTLPKGQKGPWSKRDMNAFTVLHYAPYALVEQIDKQTGKARTNNDGKAYTEWVQIQKHQRNLPQFKDKEIREAHLLHWSLGNDHWEQLTQYDKVVGDNCKSCGGVKTIESEAWTCVNCGECLIDPSTTTLAPKEFEEVTTKPVKCACCNHVGMLKEYIRCTQCNRAARAEIFDVDLEVRRLPPKDGSNRTQLMIVGCSAPGPIDARFVEIAKPMELEKVFAPTPYDKQLETWANAGGSGTRQPVTAADQSRAYGATRTLGQAK